MNKYQVGYIQALYDYGKAIKDSNVTPEIRNEFHYAKNRLIYWYKGKFDNNYQELIDYLVSVDKPDDKYTKKIIELALSFRE